MYASRQLNEDDILWLFSATSDAFYSIRDIHRKPQPWVDGEIFTHIRRSARENGASEAVRGLFCGKIKNFTCRLDGRASKKDKEMLIKMYDDFKRRAALQEPNPMTELEQALIAMQVSTKKVEDIASQSEMLRDKLESVRVILEDNEPLVKEEDNE